MDVQRYLNERGVKGLKDLYPKINVTLAFYSKEKIIESFQKMEKLHWFYLDNIHKRYPKKFLYVKFKPFIKEIIRHNALLEDYWKANKYLSIYSAWQRSRKTAGVIISSGNNYYLVKNVNSKYFTFPKGKQEENESLFDTAFREAEEETGMDVKKYLTSLNTIKINKTKYFFVNIPHMISPPKDFVSNEILDAGWFHKNYILENKKKFTRNVNQYFKL